MNLMVLVFSINVFMCSSVGALYYISVEFFYHICVPFNQWTDDRAYRIQPTVSSLLASSVWLIMAIDQVQIPAMK